MRKFALVAVICLMTETVYAQQIVPGPRPKIGPSQHIEANLLSNIPNESSGPEDFRSAGNFYG